MLQYWLDILVKAFGDSLAFMDHTTQGIVGIVVVFLVSVLWILRRSGWKKMKEHWLANFASLLGVAFVSWLCVFIGCFIAAPHGRHLEEASHVNALQRERESDGRALTSCRTELQVQDAKLDGLQILDATLQAGLTHWQQAASVQEQAAFNQSRTFDGQQVAINQCVAALIKNNGLSPLTITARISLLPLQPLSINGHASKIVAVISIADKTVTPVRLTLRCDTDFRYVGWSVAEVTPHGMVLAPGRIGQTDKRTVLVEYSEPAWPAEQPLIVWIAIDDEPELQIHQCQATQGQP